MLVKKIPFAALFSMASYASFAFTACAIALVNGSSGVLRGPEYLENLVNQILESLKNFLPLPR